MKAIARPATLLAGFATALLVLLAVGGYWVRPAADDWCYQTNMRTMSVDQFVHFLYRDSNGRAGNGLLLAWVHGLGPLGLQLYPVLVIALLLGSVWLLIARLARLSDRRVPVAAQLLTAATVSLAFLLVCPQPYQTVYWASGGISHTVPGVLSTVLVAGVLCLPGREGRAGLVGRWSAAAVLLLGFAFIALVSEAMALVVGVLAAVLWLRAGDVCADRPARRAARRGALAAAVGSAGGLLVEYLSPGMHSRSKGLGVPHGTELLHRLRDGVVTWIGDLATTLTSWDYAAVLLAGALLGLTMRRLDPQALTRAPLTWVRARVGGGTAPRAADADSREGREGATGPAGAEGGTTAERAALAADAGRRGTLTATIGGDRPDSAGRAGHGPGGESAGQAGLGSAGGSAVSEPTGTTGTGPERPTAGAARTGGTTAGGSLPAPSAPSAPSALSAASAPSAASARPATGDADASRAGGAARPAPALVVRSPLRLLLWSAAGVLLGSLLVTELVQAVFGGWIWYLVRTWNDWRLSFTLLLAAIGVAAGRLLAKSVAPVPGGPGRRRAALLLPALMPALMGLALLGLSQPAVAVVHQTKVRAQHWDAQDRQLRAQIRAGVKNPTYVASYIGRMRDAYTRSGKPDWVAACIDDYYGTHIRLPAHSTDWINQSQNAPIP